MFTHRVQKRAFTAMHLVLLLSAIALIAGAAWFTVSYLKVQTPDVPNEFVPVEVTCEVQKVVCEEGDSRDAWCVQNTGDVTAFIRATVAFNWVKVDDTDPDTASQSNVVLSASPQENVDFSILWGDTAWVRGKDGFWYYTKAVDPEEVTSDLIRSMMCNTAPAGYELRVQILATAIQAEPTTVVQTVWGASVNDNVLTPVQ